MRLARVALVASSLLGLLWPIAGLAQGGPGTGGGPGPVPDPWTVNGNAISYAGCVLIPASVTGGCEGSGSINIAAFYVNGVAVAGVVAAGITVAGADFDFRVLLFLV